MAGPVKFNGQTNNLTGVGSPNPDKLVIPYKDRMDPQMRSAMLKIEQFVNNLIAPASAGGVYASLTGPGQASTPGKLTQLGDFTVADNTGAGSGISLTTGSTAVLPIFLAANDGILNGNMAGITLSGSGTGSANIQAGHGSGANIAVTATGTATGAIQLNAPRIGFFGGATAVKQTANGSRSANVALASLLTALSTAGLITDATTI